MRLLSEGRARVRALIARVPSIAQLQHLDLFLDSWEKNLIGALSFLAVVAFVGFFWSIHLVHTTTAPAHGGDFQEVLVGAPHHINPVFAVTDTDRTLTNIVFLPLCDSFNHGVAALADHCDIATNLKSATVTLGSRIWHDGKPVTVSDVFFTIHTMQDKSVGSPWRGLANQVSVTSDAQGHIIISAKQPIPDLKTLLSLGVVPEHAWAPIDPSTMQSDALNLHPIGTGAFAFKNLSLGPDGTPQGITFEAFSKFSPHEPYLEELDFRIADDNSSSYDMFRTRQVDAIFVSDPAQTEELVKRDVHRYELTPSAVVSLFFNPIQNSKFKNPDVRDAFALAIDRASIVKTGLKGNGTPLRAPFPESLIKQPLIVEPDADAAAAAALFKKAAFNTNASSTLTLGVPNLPTYATIADQIKSQLAAFGISITIAPIGSGTKTGALLSYDLLLLGQDYGAVGNPFPYWHSTASGEAGANYARYQTKEVDSWLEQLQLDGRPDMRAGLLKQLNARLVNDTPAVFLFQPTYQYYVANKVQGVDISAANDPSERFETASEWFIATRRVSK
ncbi:MAG: ABC transporter substrate-binding protein [Candidatus Magasanikbacteria bacterium]|nr:ABC transporter substrate-binding protein [Candidatus Magasanikbacteria bacterium]